jgi:Predicted permease
MQTSFLGNEIRTINLRDNQSLPWAEKFLLYIFKRIDLSSYTPTIVSYGKVVGTWSMYIFLALILSLFFILEKQKLSRFFLKFNESKLSGLYNYLVFFGKNFLDSFGKVIQAQIIIAFVNTVISGIALWIFGFPQVMALCLMIFIFSLIPVVGVIITLIPLVLIAYKIGGMLKIIYVLVMVGLLHTVTSYIIYPKLMADKTEIPIFLTFVILIIGEHFMGVWGLLLGIPLFIFFMDLLDIKMMKKN